MIDVCRVWGLMCTVLQNCYYSVYGQMSFGVSRPEVRPAVRGCQCVCILMYSTVLGFDCVFPSISLCIFILCRIFYCMYVFVYVFECAVIAIIINKTKSCD